MARKPHNFAHFQNLVNELKSQNENNIATLSDQMAIQTGVLMSLQSFFVKSRQQDTLKEKEARLEASTGKTGKSLLSGKGVAMPRFSGKGFMGMLGDFLSTALMGIPGGLSKFLPARLGLPLLGSLSRGIAALVAGPKLLEALEAGFNQETFSGGVQAFFNTFFGEEEMTSFGESIAGGAGKGALLGITVLGPKGAILGGILGGALMLLKNVFQKDEKLDVGKLYDRVKEHLKNNISVYAPLAGTVLGAKMGMLGGPTGMIVGALLGGAIGYLVGEPLAKVLADPNNGDWDTVTTNLKKEFYNQLMQQSYVKVALGGAILGAGLGAFTPVGIIGGAIIGVALGLIFEWLTRAVVGVIGPQFAKMLGLKTATLGTVAAQYGIKPDTLRDAENELKRIEGNASTMALGLARSKESVLRDTYLEMMKQQAPDDLAKGIFREDIAMMAAKATENPWYAKERTLPGGIKMVTKKSKEFDMAEFNALRLMNAQSRYNQQRDMLTTAIRQQDPSFQPPAAPVDARVTYNSFSYPPIEIVQSQTLMDKVD